MNRFSVTGTIISRIFAAAGVIMSVAVLFCVAFEQTKESTNKGIKKMLKWKEL